MTELLIGYARVSTNEQDLTAQQNALERIPQRALRLKLSRECP
ncbi:recombinase family protein [Subtercola sp. Z020]